MFLGFFYVKVLIFVDDFFKGAIYGKLKIFGSYPDHHQSNVYVDF